MGCPRLTDEAVMKIHDPEYQEQFTRKDLPPELSDFCTA